MKKRILILENCLYTAENLKEFINTNFGEFISNKLEIIICNDIYEANENLKENTDISCIISDLNMCPNGLEEKYHEETFGTMLTGWVWIKYYILAKKEYSKIPIIIYSGFVDVLKTNSDFGKYMDTYQIELIDKGNNEKILCEKIREIITREV